MRRAKKRPARRGKPPKPPTSGPQVKDQVNLTDEESRIMPTSGGGFEQACNAQAGVDVKTHLIVAQHVTRHTNDKQDIEPALAAIGQLPEVLGEADNLLADTGYFSEANVEKCTQAGSGDLRMDFLEKYYVKVWAAIEKYQDTLQYDYIVH